MTRIDCGACVLRPWRGGDEASLAHHGNSRALWLNLRDRFPHPYTLADAREWVALAGSELARTHLAIEVQGAAVGGIGIDPGTDVERCSAEIGYWIGEAFRGRGIATAALAGMTEYAFREFPLTRVFALPFARNAASCRVLEKAGYVREGLLRRSAVKDGEVLDQVMYASIRG